MIDQGRFDTTTGSWYNRRVVIRNDIRKDKLIFVRLYNPSKSETSIAINRYRDSEPLSNVAHSMVIIARKSNAT